MRPLHAKGILAIITVAILATGSLHLSAREPSNGEKALAHVSDRESVPVEHLQLVTERTVHFALTGRTLWVGKVADATSSRSWSVAVDEHGQAIDNLDELRADEEAAAAATFGKRDANLARAASDAGADDLLSIAIWLKNTPAADAAAKSGSAAERAQRVADLKRTYADVERPVLGYLQGQGHGVAYASEYAPLVLAQVPARALDALEARDDVAALYLANEFGPEMSDAVWTIQANTVWSRGITGAGPKIAIVESGGVEFANPFLADGLYYNSATKNIDAHPTGIAGIIQSVDATERGIAHGGPAILSANAGSFADSSIIAATEWALNNGASIVSNSWGADTNLVMGAMDRYLDHLVWEHFKTVTKSAGNRGETDGDVTSPGLGFNMITVGAIDDFDTGTIRADDLIASYSSYGDPVSSFGDREKPEVAAPGSGISSTTTANPWIGNIGSGTSYAGPMVAAEAALLIQRRAWLDTWPEVIKAIIMASASYNVEGASRLSEKDGAGVIDVSHADNVARFDQMAGLTLASTNFPKTLTFRTPPGHTVRVAVVWDAHPDNAHPPSSDTLMADLDVVVTNPLGQIVGSSTSFDNSYEIVEFRSTVGGVHTVTISAPRFQATQEFVGVAWHCFVPKEADLLVWPNLSTLDGLPYVHNQCQW